MPDTVKRILSSTRFWEHLPAGVLNAVLLVRYPVFGCAFLFAFLVYELWQCYRTHDLAHHDIIGHLGGMALGGILILGGLL